MRRLRVENCPKKKFFWGGGGGGGGGGEGRDFSNLKKN